MEVLRDNNLDLLSINPWTVLCVKWLSTLHGNLSSHIYTILLFDLRKHIQFGSKSCRGRLQEKLETTNSELLVVLSDNDFSICSVSSKVFQFMALITYV